MNAGAQDSLGTGDGILLYGNMINTGSSKFTNSPLVFAGSTTQTVSGNPFTLASGLVTLNAAGVNLQTNLTVTSGTVQTTGTYDVNIGGGTTSTLPVVGVINTGASTIFLNPTGLITEGSNPENRFTRLVMLRDANRFPCTLRNKNLAIN